MSGQMGRARAASSACAMAWLSAKLISLFHLDGGIMSIEALKAAERSVRTAVEDYCKLHGIGAFSFSEVYDLQNDWFKSTFPNSGRAGCYVFYDETGKLVYIGKASLNSNLGFRIGTYFHRDKVRDVTEPRPGQKWKTPLPPRYLQTIPVDEPYQAPSLEEYLILKLQPPGNTSGIVR